MKKRMKYLILSVLLITVFSAVTASAKNVATAVLEKAESGNDVTVSIEFPGSKSEAITSLRFKLLAAVEEPGDVSFESDSVSFDFSNLTAEVKDASITYDSDVTDYVIDIVVSGKHNIFQNAEEGVLEIGTLHLPFGDYYAEVGCVVTDDVESSASELQYVENAGLQTMTAQLKNSETVQIGKKEQPDTEPEDTEPAPQKPENPKESESVPDPTNPVPTEPVPSGSATGSEASSGSAGGGSSSVTKPELSPAEPKKNGLSAPKLTVKPITGTKKLSFSWKKVKGAQGYQIFRYDEKTGKYKKYKKVKGTSYTAKFSYGKTYRFKVRAYKKKNGSNVYGAFSAEKEVTVSSFNKQKKPSLRVTLPAKAKKLSFTWSQVSGAEGYQILRYVEEKKQYKVVKTIKSGDTLKCQAVKYNFAEDYRFRIRAFACDEGGNKVLGAESAEFTITTPPAQVSKIKVKSPEEFMIKVTWKKVEGADGYIIYRSEPDEKETMKKLAKVKGNVRSFIDEELEGGARYYYQVAAFKRAPNGKRKTGERSAIKSAEVK